MVATARQPAYAAASGGRVAVFGGGVAGLTAAHELVERGFEVTVYERRALGGKARSIPVPGSGRDGRPDLPGEHGFRFFPGFYKHLPDTMRRIPCPGNAHGVWDNLVPVAEERFARSGGDGAVMPAVAVDRPWADAEDFRQTVSTLITTSTKMPSTEGAYFADRLLVFATSSDARRLGQWENVAWRDFVGARERSAEFRMLLSRSLTTLLVAARDDTASTRTIGTMGEQFLANPRQIANDGPVDRVLNGPTNKAWIDPWVQYLRQQGVRFEIAEVCALDCGGGRVSGARLADGRTVSADTYVVAVPVEAARRLWTPDLLATAPELGQLGALTTGWMNGIQFYLRRSAAITRGHTAYVDAPWSLTSISQNQFWGSGIAGYGDGTVQDCLSVDISDWDSPGILYGKPAKQCQPEEIAREVWAQLKTHLVGRAALHDEDLHSWFLDPAIAWNASENTNADPLLINTVGSWQARPQSHGAVENLFLAADYVRTGTDLATMEGACEAARLAVNAVLDSTGSGAPRCGVFPLYRAVELEPLRQLDDTRYRAGLPNVFDVAA